jgi:hypothetical protein
MFADRGSRVDGRVARAPHYVARNVGCVDVQTLPCRQRIYVRGSWVDGRGSRFTVRGSRFAGRSSRSRCSDATLSSRGTSVAQTFGWCGTSSMSLSQLFAVRGSVAQQAPHYFRAERPLWGRSGGVVSSGTCIRLTSFPTFSPYRSTRIVEVLEWERTPAPPLGGLLTRIKGPGRLYTRENPKLAVS